MAPSRDAEALRLVQSMPDWKPAGKNGNVIEVELAYKSPYEGLNQEALRVIKSMPRWESPGKVKGHPVHVSYTLPINFFI